MAIPVPVTPFTPQPASTVILPQASTLGNLSAPINQQSVSFQSIRADLLNWALQQPNGQAWSSWFDTDDGIIIAEWVAGLATFRKMAEIMRMRESTLDYAQLTSSVFNLAFNRGLLIAPALAAQVQLTVAPINSQTSVVIGDLVATMGGYDLFSLQGKTLHGPTDTILCAVGHLNKYTPQFSVLGPFTQFTIPLSDTWVAAQLESFMADTVSIPLVAEPINLGGQSNTFVLRRVMPNEVRIYVGNGVLGWYDESVATITYTTLTYGTDVLQALKSGPQMVLSPTLKTWTVTGEPSFDPDKETVRAIARYYPIDGRVVQDVDYESVIKKYFGGVLNDVYAVNTDPNEVVYLLANDNFGTGPAAVEQQAAIVALLDTKRGLGIQIFYHLLQQTQGLSFSATLVVYPASAYSYALQLSVNTLANQQLFRFARHNMTLTVVDVATQLSAAFGVQFVPQDSTIAVVLRPQDFFSSFSVTLTTPVVLPNTSTTV